MAIYKMDTAVEMEIFCIRSGVYPNHFFEREPTNEKSPLGLFLQMYCFDKSLRHSGVKGSQHDDDKQKGKG